MTFAVALAAPHPGAAGAARTINGNAFDAALAAAAALTVAYPHQCSIGGDLVAIVRPAGRPPRAVLSIGAAAAATDVEALRAAADHMPVTGPHTITVPGVVAGWAAVAALGATRPLRDLLAPAISMAEHGVAVSPGLRRATVAGLDTIRADPGLTALLLDGDRRRDHLVQPALARTLTAIAEDWRSFYDRPPLVKGLRDAGSLLDAADFAAHRSEVIDPLSRTVGGVAWFAAPPPVQGATFLDLVGSKTLLADAWRARAARDAYLGDPRTEPINLDGLQPHRTKLAPPPDSTQHAVASAHKSEISGRAAESSGEEGGTQGEGARREEERSEGARREEARSEGAQSEEARSEGAPSSGSWADGGVRATGDTVAVTAVDSDGNAVTLIQSVFFSFGAGLLDPATGVVLHNRGSSFSLDPGHPGRIQGGSRPPHTLCPTVGVTPDGVVALGCQGGRSQPWILAQVAADVVGAGDLDELVGRPRWVIGAGEIGRAVPTLLLEPGLAAAEAGDYAVEATTGRHDDAGHVQVARLRGEVLDAGSDPRADGVAVVLRR
ncbi:gamma-glutamyltransferase [Paractinoplanes atraurantiacus]|uniref:Gamma-glutamyltranspeptidase / glutathione hydrolase n=1 Tax=Paractinoplanes atraurantiacus TaxID=1036182 RepID=A0A285JZG5_9ACTN|nr:gamma-glutamyltransferase [Actinoplanes atraurantiacus]SNY65463.1 gamma-glutamyltranspeptidase / glutathione hydrolase [Actinoplanes atraurantiacus]